MRDASPNSEATASTSRPSRLAIALALVFTSVGAESVLSADIETVNSLVENVPSISVDLGASPPVVATPGQKIPLRDVLAITYEPSFSTPGQFLVTLADGSEVTGDLSEGDAEGQSIRLSSPFFAKPKDISLEGVRRIRRTRARGEVTPKVGDETDRLHLVKGGLVEGILTSVTPDRVVFEDNKLGEVSFNWDQLIGLDLAALDEAPTLPAGSIRVAVIEPSGGRLQGALTSLDARQVEVENPVIGKIAISVRQLSAIEFRLGRVAYLSDREPIEVVEGVDEALIDKETFHLFYRWQKDRSVERTPLRIGKRSFRKGLGVHSDSKLVYEVRDGDRTFQSWIGIDATGQPPTPNPKYGSVIFRVVVDGVEKVKEAINWEKPARHIQVDLQGAKRLELIVEQGPGFHICDCADWGDARIIRK